MGTCKKNTSGATINMPIVKFVYFDIQAKGELTRLLLAAGNIDYEDFRVGFSDWPGEIKATTPFGQMPVLYWDGEELAQSMAISRLLPGRLASLVTPTLSFVRLT